MTTRQFIESRLLVVFAIFALTAPLLGQVHFEYPAPRYPELRDVETAADLLDIARPIVTRENRAESGFLVGWGIKPGFRVLLAVDSEYDRRVIDALEMAIREAGAKPDVLFLDYHSFHLPIKPAEGAREIDQFEQRMESPKLFVKKYVEAVAEYHVVINGGGGANPPHAGYSWGGIPWKTLDEFISGTADYPAEIVEALDEKVWQTVLSARKVRITDPEGTDISWTVSREEHEEAVRRRGGRDILYRGHIMSHPFLEVKNALDAKGVIAGVANHTGFFPRIEVYIDNNQVTRIEAGGSYGENWKAMLEKYKDIQWPDMPGPGIGWLWEVAIGTNPKSARPANVMIQPSRIISWERARTGVIHWGIGLTGARTTASGTLSQTEWAKQNNLPTGHFHVHTYFNTFEIETEDGQTIKLIDKGHLTALDDPEIRKIAAKYGDPDEVLREAWIPAIPGINVEGDYERDYAADPGGWVRKEHEEAYGEWLAKHYQ